VADSGYESSLGTLVAGLMIDIEAELRTLGLWDPEPPPAEALASDQPFSIDTLTFPQWLQFIFLPTLYHLLDTGEPLPRRCGIAPMAEEYFRGLQLPSDPLVAALLHIDQLLSAEGGR